jgi:hypothetical protein
MSEMIERAARAIYEVNPVVFYRTQAGLPLMDLAEPGEPVTIPWEKVRDEQWHIYFVCVDQALAANEALK